MREERGRIYIEKIGQIVGEKLDRKKMNEVIVKKKKVGGVVKEVDKVR